MKTCDAIHRLTIFQDRILACLAETCRLVEAEGVGGRDALARRRWEMMRMLREYQLFKHAEIFDPLIATGNRDRIAAATAMKARCLAAGEEFTAHVRLWSGASIECEWPTYEAALTRMIATLRRHIEVERRGVEALLRGTVSTRGMAMASG